MFLFSLGCTIDPLSSGIYNGRVSPDYPATRTTKVKLRGVGNIQQDRQCNMT